MKRIILSGLIGVFLLAFELQGGAQDKVYLHSHDSVLVKISGDPRKDTDLSNKSIGYMNDYGFKSVVVLYSKDSIRIHRPGDIRAYFKETPGTYLGAGYFFSRTINERNLGYKRDNSRAVFLQRVNHHKDLILWFYREDLGHPMPDCYFLAETRGQPYMDLILSYRDWKKWAVNHPPLGEISAGLGKPKGGKKETGNLFRHMVEVMEEYKKRLP